MSVGVRIGPFYASTHLPRSDPKSNAIITALFGPGAVIGFVLANLTQWHGWYDLVNDRSIDWTLKGAFLTPIVLAAAFLFAVACNVNLFDPDLLDSILGCVVVSLMIGLYTGFFALLAVLASLVLGDYPHRLTYVSVATLVAILPVAVIGAYPDLLPEPPEKTPVNPEREAWLDRVAAEQRAQRQDPEMK